MTLDSVQDLSLQNTTSRKRRKNTIQNGDSQKYNNNKQIHNQQPRNDVTDDYNVNFGYEDYENPYNIVNLTTIPTIATSTTTKEMNVAAKIT